MLEAAIYLKLNDGSVLGSLRAYIAFQFAIRVHLTDAGGRQALGIVFRPASLGKSAKTLTAI